MLGFFYDFLSSVVVFFVCFFLNQHFEKNITGIPSECQTVWIQIRPEDQMSGLVWVQTDCKGNQLSYTGRQRVHVQKEGLSYTMGCPPVREDNP